MQAVSFSKVFGAGTALEVHKHQSDKSKSTTSPDRFCDIHGSESPEIEFIRDELRFLENAKYAVSELGSEQRTLLSGVGSKITKIVFPFSGAEKSVPLTDEALELIAAVFPKLVSLDIKAPLEITKRGIGELKKLQLKALCIREPKTLLGQEILEVISNMPLQKFWVTSATFSFEGFQLMERLRLLTVLSLKNAKWTTWAAKPVENGEALKHLGFCVHLKYLDISGTKTKDSDLKYLSELPLEVICLENCDITKAGLEEFNKVFPHLNKDSDEKKS